VGKYDALFDTPKKSKYDALFDEEETTPRNAIERARAGEVVPFAELQKARSENMGSEQAENKTREMVGNMPSFVKSGLSFASGLSKGVLGGLAEKGTSALLKATTDIPNDQIESGIRGILGKLQEDAPISNVVGEIGAFAAPSGIAGKAGKIGIKAGQKAVGIGAKTLGKKLLGAGIEGATTGLISGGLRGGVGEVGEDMSIKRGLKSGAIEMAVGGLSGVASKAIGTGLKEAASRISSGLTGVSREALDVAGTKAGRESLKSASGRQQEIGEDLVDLVDNYYEVLPEREIIDNALENMPNVKTKNVIDALENAKPKTAGTTAAKKAIVAIDQQIEILKDFGEAVPATEFRALRGQFDEAIGEAFNTDGGTGLIKALKKARGVMAKDLVETAEASGKPEFAEAMKTLSNKLQKRDDVLRFLGKNGKTRDARVESFISNLFGKNKKYRQKAVKELGDLFGKDFLEQSKLTSLAAEFGEEGVPGFLPRQTTGKALLGLGLGAGAGGAAFGDERSSTGALIGASLTSPKIATRLLPKLTSGAFKTATRRGLSGVAARKLQGDRDLDTMGNFKR